MIRLRRLPGTWLRRKLYEVEFTESGAATPSWHRTTKTPVTLIDKTLGVGEAWALVHAADENWNGGVGPWVSLSDE